MGNVKEETLEKLRNYDFEKSIDRSEPKLNVFPSGTLCRIKTPTELRKTEEIKDQSQVFIVETMKIAGHNTARKTIQKEIFGVGRRLFSKSTKESGQSFRDVSVYGDGRRDIEETFYITPDTRQYYTGIVSGLSLDIEKKERINVLVLQSVPAWELVKMIFGKRRIQKFEKESRGPKYSQTEIEALTKELSERTNEDGIISYKDSTAISSMNITSFYNWFTEEQKSVWKLYRELKSTNICKVLTGEVYVMTTPSKSSYKLTRGSAETRSSSVCWINGKYLEKVEKEGKSQ